MNNVSTNLKPSENILKLRALINRLEKNEAEVLYKEYKDSLCEIKNVMECEQNEIDSSNSIDGKLNRYEQLCSKITSLLNKIKL